MATPFMANYVRLLIATCHKRGVHAMGGMAAQIPGANDPAANAAATEKVKVDKEREVKAGCDGTWVAHPASVDQQCHIAHAHCDDRAQAHVHAKMVAMQGCSLCGRQSLDLNLLLRVVCCLPVNVDW